MMKDGRDGDRAPLHGRGGEAAVRSGRKGVKWCFITACVLALVVLFIVAVAVGVTRHNGKKGGNSQNAALTVGDAVNNTCTGADDADLCVQTLLASVNQSDLSVNSTVDLKTIASFPLRLLNATRSQMTVVQQGIDDLVLRARNTSWEAAARACNASLYDSLPLLEGIVNATDEKDYDAAKEGLAALRTETADCAEALFEALNLTFNATSSADSVDASFTTADGLFSGTLGATLYNSTVAFSFHLSNALTVVKNVGQGAGAVGGRRRLYRRRLLAQAEVDRNVQPDFVVSPNGDAEFKKVQEAVNAAVDLRSRKPDRRIVIKIKAGVYREKVLVPKDLWGLTVIGEGPYRSIIRWNDYTNPMGTTGLRTRETSTFAVEGRGFLAIDMTFENDAGQSATVQQAVALRASLRSLSKRENALGDGLAAFVGCHFLAHQDTLYSHSGWQYYYQCRVDGTVDYVFGNAAAVYQDCDLNSIRTNGTNTVTAQARTSESEPTGFVFRGCRVDKGSADQHVFMGQNHPYRFVYLGRPWKPFSRVVFMFCELGGIDPKGWMIWTTVGKGSDNHETAQYYEYKNSGPGSATEQRVRWSRSLTDAEAEDYTVENFIHGGEWLAQIGVPAKIWG
ncbi:hypothetical protein CBR_g17560 [Chara braunii]|uniref:Pectinesterase n=1 Tax=Chara braunii TaxID=69332 RepID=A0A388KUX7_CHABU|nr:hypothetical protein CBR_g17560 [Chara braunii]|eukprot:GBG73849.1 hypothetical protein CBR_g17560 [Chara braunii]